MGARFWIANEWYWSITEGATTLTIESAIRDFVRPFLKLLGRGEVSPALVVTLAERETPIALAQHATDRVALSHLLSDLNKLIAPNEMAFAITVPKRYELCGELLELAELDRMYGDPQLLVPSTRRSSQ